MQRQPRQQLVLPEPQEMGTLLVRGSVAFARRNPTLTSTYFVGILLLIIFGGGGRPLSADQHHEYHRILATIDTDAEYRATEDFWRDDRNYRRSQGWFWSCDGTCQRLKARMKQSEHILMAIRQEGAVRTAHAKSVAGLLSEVGIGEVQDSFWSYFHSGQRFAKRQSMWDLMFMGIRSMSRGRDESWVEFGLKVLMQVLLNISLGLAMALVFFVIGLWTIVRSYQPNPLFAVIFFCGAAVAAFSFVATYLLAIYGAAAGGVYTILKVGENAAQARLGEQRRQERMGYGGARPHYH